MVGPGEGVVAERMGGAERQHPALAELGDTRRGTITHLQTAGPLTAKGTEHHHIQFGDGRELGDTAGTLQWAVAGDGRVDRRRELCVRIGDHQVAAALHERPHATPGIVVEVVHEDHQAPDPTGARDITGLNGDPRLLEQDHRGPGAVVCGRPGVEGRPRGPAAGIGQGDRSEDHAQDHDAEHPGRRPHRRVLVVALDRTSSLTARTASARRSSAAASPYQTFSKLAVTSERPPTMSGTSRTSSISSLAVR